MFGIAGERLGSRIGESDRRVLAKRNIIKILKLGQDGILQTGFILLLWTRRKREQMYETILSKHGAMGAQGCDPWEKSNRAGEPSSQLSLLPMLTLAFCLEASSRPWAWGRWGSPTELTVLLSWRGKDGRLGKAKMTRSYRTYFWKREKELQKSAEEAPWVFDECGACLHSMKPHKIRQAVTRKL